MTDQHISHSELVAAADGELSSGRATEIRAHLAACWPCRTRAKEIEDAIAEFVHLHQDSVTAAAADAPRAMFRARLAELALQPPPSWRDRFADYFMQGNRVAYVAGAMAGTCAILFVVGVVQVSRQQFRLMPDPALTPGATLPISQAEVCQMPANTARVIPASVGRQVFDHYGIDRPRPRDYELDHLIAPELGGADDPRNYWPQPYGVSDWNAHVKDALEDRLHELVCENKLSLATAQHDISENWILAYKKYFQTQKPIASHRAFTKDAPWEP
ncbi:MAG: zf-HC2 domain-containing protein [Bryobacteraceae bacterium]